MEQTSYHDNAQEELRSDDHSPATRPMCKKIYMDPPALSITDNKTLICPDCRTRESLQVLGVSAAEQEEIIGQIHRARHTTKKGR